MHAVSRERTQARTHGRAGIRTNARVSDREVDVDRREDKLLRTRDELEAAVALHETGDVGKPPGIDVTVLVHLPGKRGERKIPITTPEK